MTSSTDRDEAVFQIRKGSPEMVDEWAEFVASCFADKQPRPSKEYFLGKILADSSFNAERDIRLFRDDNGDIIATLRLFRGRSVNLATGSLPWPFIGVGEVSVRKDFRGRGVAHLLMKETIRLEEEQAREAKHDRQAKEPKLLKREQVHLVLHASLVQARRLYARNGFESCAHRIEYIRIAPKRDWLLGVGLQVRECDLASDTDIEHLHNLYSATAMEGTLVRNLEYWTHWVIGRWKSRRGSCFLFNGKESESPIGYAYFYPFGDKTIRLDEFALLRETANGQDSQLFLNMIATVARPNQSPVDGEMDKPFKVEHVVVNRNLLIRYANSGIDLETDSQIAFIDEGWMIRTSENDSHDQGLVQIPFASGGVFYDADGF